LSAPLITSNDGNSIPQVGLGVWQTPPEDTERAVAAALAAGYRHIDTAAAYGNEKETGRAIKGSGLDRSEVYLVTKLWNSEQGYDATLAAFDASVDRLVSTISTCTSFTGRCRRRASSSRPSRPSPGSVRMVASGGSE
jgi:2,5-diketo-D-gluconate reductase A